MFVQRKEALQFKYVEEISNNAETILFTFNLYDSDKTEFPHFYI